jgi:oxidase EvaA
MSESLLQWLQAQRALQTCAVESISLDDSREWLWADGSIKHRTGRFFNVVGVRDETTGWHAPLLDQWEIGTLAFIRREREGEVEILVQAKLEPGDLGLSQLAPAVQATASNLDRVHGGSPPTLRRVRDAGERQRC